MMHGDDDRQPLVHQAPQQPLDGGALLRIETGQRLIQQQDAGARRERPRDERPPHLAIGQFARPPVGERSELEESQPALGSPRVCGARRIGEADAGVAPARDQIPYRHVNRVVGLQFRRHVADPAFPIGDRRSPRMSRALDAAAQSGREVAVEELQETGLARAVCAEHGPVLALAQFPVDLPKHPMIIDVQTHLPEPNQRQPFRGGRRPPHASARPARPAWRAMLAGIASQSSELGGSQRPDRAKPPRLELDHPAGTPGNIERAVRRRDPR